MVNIRLIILLYLSITGSWAVCMGDTTLSRPFFAPYIPYIGYAIDLFFIAFLSNRHLKVSDIYLLLVPIIALILFNTNVYNRNTYSPNVLFFLHLIVFSLTVDSVKLQAYKIIRIIFIVASLFGIIAFISYKFNLGLPFSQVPYYDENPNSFYIDYKIAYIVERIGFCRLCGFVNEPGLFATLISLLLISDEFDIKKKGNIILIVAAFLTFSTAFYIITLTYFILKYLNSWKMILLLTLIVSIGVYFLLVVGTDNEIITAMTIAKFEGGLSEARSNIDIESAMDRLIKSGGIWWGFGNGYVSSHITEGSSYKNIILDYGIMGMLILYIPLLWAALKKSGGNKTALILIACFFLSIFQRPNVFNPIYFLVLFGGMEYIKANYALLKTKITPPYNGRNWL